MAKQQKRVLLLAPPYMDIYKDIIDCLESKQYEVVWISDGLIPHNPYNKSNLTRHTKSVEQYQSEVNTFWSGRFSKDDFSRPFDYFLAIDGFMVTPQFFEMLNTHSPSIRKVLYLYDRVKGNYEIDMFFKYYSDVYSFDLGDCAYYKLHHLPIYWVPSTEQLSDRYDIFGFGAFQWGERYKVYKAIKDLVQRNGLKDYIKLFYRPNKSKFSYLLRFVFYKVQGKNYLSLSEIKDELFTDKSLSPDEFRNLILCSKVILDTQNSNQDGMTARFMWALGAEKKIITTNKAVVENTFYSPGQIYVLSDSTLDGVMNFISSDFKMSEEMRGIVQQYRIDNWVDTMFIEERLYKDGK